MADIADQDPESQPPAACPVAPPRPSLDRFALGLGTAVASAAIASFLAGAGLPSLAIAALAGALLGYFGAPGAPFVSPRPLAERLAPAAALVFFVPLATMAVAPGADMAMHGALARALVSGGSTLSPAWGDAHALLYPRGLSAIVALSAPLAGYAAAGLVAAGLAHAVFLLGLRAFLRDALRLAWPGVVAALAVTLSRTPQDFFGWGGNPTVLAMGLGLLAAALLARTWVEPLPIRSAVIAGLLLAGGVATHPIGAIAGAVAAAGGVLARLHISRRGDGASLPGGGLVPCAVALCLMLGAMLAAKLGGPELSPSERDWIADYQRATEAVVPGPAWLFFVGVWRALPRVFGPTFSVVLLVAGLVEVLSADGRRRLAWTAAAIVAIGALLAFGPSLPLVGFLLYPLRLAPLLVVATAPLLASAYAELARRSSRAAGGALAAVAVLAVGTHVDRFELQRPMATRNDVRAIECVRQTVPATAVVAGAYGDATQWIPALTGLAITRAHTHCSLFDEAGRAGAASRPTHLFVGERLRYPSEPGVAVPASSPVCRVGGAALYRLEAAEVATAP